MAKPVSIPNSFATSTAAIPLSYLDQDFNALANSTNDLATYSNYVADTGAANAYIANFPTNTNTSSLTAGLRVQFKAANANSGASTLNVQVNSVSIGSGSIVLTDGTALPANAIVANAVVDVIYDGSNFQLINYSYNFSVLGFLFLYFLLIKFARGVGKLKRKKNKNEQ